MKNVMKLFLTLFCALALVAPAFCYTTGTVNYKEILTNYSKAQKAFSDLDDQASSLQRFLLDKEKEFKKLTTPVQKQAFEEQTAKAYAQKREALAKLQIKKEQEINKAIDDAIKAVALENKIDAVVEESVMFYGGVDITAKVIKKLNLVK